GSMPPFGTDYKFNCGGTLANRREATKDSATREQRIESGAEEFRAACGRHGDINVSAVFATVRPLQ
ncbi:MAG: hypothetical protein OXE81_08535, partial [Gammaproteobacteria bacterium]|nr:hypothetical protein [Gammaproteobacteria bacterium]